MPFVRILAVLMASLSVLACSVNAPPIMEHAAIEIPDGKNTKTIELRKITSKVARGTEIGKIGEGWGCLGFQKALWQAGRANIADSDLQSVFVDELRRHNYNVLGDPDDLFESKAGRAELAVGGLVTNIKWDICFHNGYLDNWSAGSTYVEIGIEWQVYNTMDKKTIYKCFTTGQAKADFASRQYEEGFRLAMAHAVRGLLADKGFLNVAMEKEPTGAMGGLTDIGTGDAGSTAAKSQPAAGVATKTKAGSVAAAQSRVVVLQFPGGHGSGFLIGTKGYILTNQHVVNDLKAIRVLFPDGTKAEGRVLASDARQDVALVQVYSPPVSGLPVRLEDLQVGTDVYAIGAPKDMAFSGSVSKGVVSSYRTDKRGRWLQSDTTVNKGNSGGPLVDASGTVVGICSWGFVQEKGINFFVPIADALRIMGISAQ